MADFHTAKLGKDGTRIWLEGSRLLAHGLTKGKLLSREWQKKKLIIRVVTETQHAKLERANKGRVSGTDDRPVIDITGEIVKTTFPKAAHVDVSYDRGFICITA